MADTISGIVDRVHGNGLTLAGREGWINQSKFTSNKSMPSQGEHVMLYLDKAGFIRSWDRTAGGGGPTTHNPGAFTATPAPAVSYGVARTKDELIVRQVALKAGVDFAGVLAAHTGKAAVPISHFDIITDAQFFYDWVMTGGSESTTDQTDQG